MRRWLSSDGTQIFFDLIMIFYDLLLTQEPMQMKTNYLHADLTEQIIKAFYNVYNFLGFGFLEKVYENAMMIELGKLGLSASQQQSLDVYYHGKKVGLYYADILVEEKVVVEIKAAEDLCPDHEAQLVNYLRATELEVGLLLNFGKEPQLKRRVLTAEYKKRKS